jgi:hypothetical protein
MFLQKVHVENFSQNFDKNFRCQFFLDFFCFIAFSGVSQRWEFKNTTKNVLQKNRRKVFTKNLTKNPKPTFSRNFLSRFWAFLDKGSSKTRLKKYRKNKSDPSPFSYFDPPTHHGGHRFLFVWRPLKSPLRLRAAYETCGTR